MNIIVRLPNGRECTFPCQQNTKIEEIKKFASKESSTDIDRLAVIYNVKKLDDNATIESSGLEDNAKVTIMAILIA